MSRDQRGGRCDRRRRLRASLLRLRRRDEVQQRGMSRDRRRRVRDLRSRSRRRDEVQQREHSRSFSSWNGRADERSQWRLRASRSQPRRQDVAKSRESGGSRDGEMEVLRTHNRDRAEENARRRGRIGVRSRWRRHHSQIFASTA